MKRRLIVILVILMTALLLSSCDEIKSFFNEEETTGGNGEPCTVKWAGVRVSEYGFDENFPSTSQLVNFGQKMSSCYEGSTGSYILIVGTISSIRDKKTGAVTGGRCSLEFPLSKTIDNAYGTEKQESPYDFYEAYLTALDQAGYSVWLQVEPGDADLVELATEVMNHYKNHTCVKGFGIDVEWYEYRKAAGAKEGDSSKLTDAEAKKVLKAVQSIKPEYTVFVKHWDTKYLPSKMEGLIYVNDSQQFDSIDHAKREFSEWAGYYAPQPVMFQIGYDDDEDIWSKYKNPAKEYGQAIVDACKSGNDVGIVWVDFTFNEVVGKIK